MFSVGISEGELRKLFDSKQVLVLPDSWPILSEALNRGVPANEVHRRAKVVTRLARALDAIAVQKAKK